jgi:hypothetical protein
LDLNECNDTFKQMKYHFAAFVLIISASFILAQEEVKISHSQDPYRVIISSDFPPLDVIPGGAGHGPAEKRSVANKQNILDLLDVYDQVDETLRRHDPRYPHADQLRSVTWEGSSGNWGNPSTEILGKGKDSEASEAIVKVIDRSDPRPVCICVWGGPQEVAHESWGGRYVQRDTKKNHRYDGPGSESVSKWLPDIQEDFAIRADWMRQ